MLGSAVETSADPAMLPGSTIGTFGHFHRNGTVDWLRLQPREEGTNDIADLLLDGR